MKAALKVTAYTDGACRISNPGLCASGFIVYRGEEEIHRSARVLEGLNTNNFAEYSGLIDLLNWATNLKIIGMTIFSDSKLVVEQVNGVWGVSLPMLPLRREAHRMLWIGLHSLEHVKGHAGNPGNTAVDALCNAVLDKYQGKEPKRSKAA